MTKVSAVQRWIGIGGLVLLGGIASGFEEHVNKHSARVEDFEKRVAAYMKLHGQAAAGVPAAKPTESAEAITAREQALADHIRALRPDAKHGDIFTSEIATEFRRLVSMTLHSPEAEGVKHSMNHAEPVSIKLRVNDAYPRSLPLQSTPPSLLANLPTLPKELEYRVIGHDLVLRDIPANLIVDYTGHALP